MMFYKPVLKGYAIELHPLVEGDCDQIFAWRNLPEIREKMTDSAELDYNSHVQWFAKMLTSDAQLHYKIVYKNKEIGVVNLKSNCTLTESTEAEIGLYIADSCYRGNLIAFAPSLLLIDYAFEQLAISKLKSQVRCSNQEALRYNQQLGYEVLSEDEKFAIISLTSERYALSTSRLKAFLSRN